MNNWRRLAYAFWTLSTVEFVLLLALLFGWQRTDVNRDGAVNVLDVQLVVNAALEGE